MGPRGQLEQDAPPVMGGHGGPRPVDRQRDLLGQPVQRLAPVAQLPGQLAAFLGGVAQQVALPQHIVGVLHRQRLPHRLPAGTPRRVRDGQIPGERGHGPAVTGDVMDHELQDALILGRYEQPGAQGYLGAEVEPFPGLLRQRGLKPVPGDRYDGQRHIRGHRVEDELTCLSVCFRVDRAQALVTRDDVVQSCPERRGVGLAQQPDGHRFVVHGVLAAELVEEPQPLLGGGQRDLRRALGGDERLPRAPSPGQLLDQACDRRVLEDAAERDLRLEGLAHLAHQLGDVQRTSADEEEVVVDLDLLRLEDLRGESADDLFLRSAGAVRRGVSGRRQLRGAVLPAALPACGEGCPCPVPHLLGAVGDGECVDALLRARLREFPEERQEAFLVGLQSDLVVEVRVGVAVDLQTGLGRAVVDQEGQVVGRPGGQRAGPGGDLAEGQLVVEHHEIDVRADQSAVCGQHAEFLADVLVRVALVAGGSTQLGRDLVHQLGDRDAVGEGDPQGQNVGHHGRHAQRGAAQPVRHWQPEDHFPLAGQPLEVGGDRGEQHRWPGGLGRTAEVAQTVGLPLWQVRGPVDELEHRTWLPSGQADRLGRVGHSFRPVIPVPGPTLGALVRGVLVEQVGQRREGTVADREPGRQCRVDLRYALRDDDDGVAVGDQVVITVEPEMPFLADLEQGEQEQRVPQGVHRAVQLRGHPGTGGRLRIVLGGEVEPDGFEGEVRRGHHSLGRLTVRVIEADAQRVRLLDHVAHGLFNQLRVQGTFDVEVLAQEEDRVLRIQLLCVPDTRLGGSQRQGNVLSYGHG
ncbi:hypothetical protein A3Q37_06422 [Streptomyces sp. PTY087I2]|nr:hypothetical protein A3Q37_06422 [Streptomyces sp. PTY087I2]